MRSSWANDPFDWNKMLINRFHRLHIQIESLNRLNFQWDNIHTWTSIRFFWGKIFWEFDTSGQEKIISKSDTFGFKLTKSQQWTEFSNILLAKSDAIFAEFHSLSNIFESSGGSLEIFCWYNCESLMDSPPRMSNYWVSHPGLNLVFGSNFVFSTRHVKKNEILAAL